MDHETAVEAELAMGATRVARGAEGRFPALHTSSPVPFSPAVYGICVVCHEKTPMARLVAIPATSLCLSCARKEQRWAAAGA